MPCGKCSRFTTSKCLRKLLCCHRACRVSGSFDRTFRLPSAIRSRLDGLGTRHRNEMSFVARWTRRLPSVRREENARSKVADTYISVDIEADGPIPGEFSMLS